MHAWFHKPEKWWIGNKRPCLPHKQVSLIDPVTCVVPEAGIKDEDK